MPLITGNRTIKKAYVGTTELNAIMHAGVNLLDGTVLPSRGRVFLMSKSSLILDEGTGGPTWSRATKAWGFNELGYLEEIASGCAFFGGARLVRNLVASSEDLTVSWTKTAVTTSATVITCSAATTSQRIYLSSVALVAGQMLSLRARFTYVDIPFVQIRLSLANTTAICNLDIQNGIYSVSGTGTAASMTLVSPGVYDCLFRVPVTASVTDTPMIVQLIDSLSAVRGESFTGDGVKSIGVSRLQCVDVTNYDASYVPEYVSVGVEAAPYFGAGIDGAKYFETDWQGAPLPAASLLGFRREAAATNNLRSCRDLRAGGSDTPWWKSNTIEPELVTNGDFSADSGWVKGTGWTISGGTANFAPGTASRLTLAGVATIGKTYIVTFTIVSVSGSWFALELGSLSGPGSISSAGTYSIQLVCGTVDGHIGFYAPSGTTCVIDNVSVKEAAVQCTQATGIDGIANTATTLTATAADAIILQPISLASAARCASAYVKRRTGTGTISFTQDGGSTWTDITSLINSSTWSRVQITATLANPSVGFKISASGDAIDVDCVQNEAGAVATSPIVTTTAAVTRNADSLTYQTASNWSDTAGTAYIEAQPWKWSVGGLLGSATNGLLESASNSGATAYDGTNAANGPTGTPSGRKKLALRWTGATMDVSVGGVIGTAGTYDGAMGLASLGIAVNSSGYFGPSAVWNYAMTDDEFKALTT